MKKIRSPLLTMGLGLPRGVTKPFVPKKSSWRKKTVRRPDKRDWEDYYGSW